jgi:HSP20 family protein
MTLIKRNLNHWVPSFWNDFLENEWPEVPGLFTNNKAVPAVNVKETNDLFQLEVSAPGLKKEDFILELNNNLLSISSKHENVGEENSGYTKREFNYQSFSRVFSLPDSVDSGNIKASYNQGVLNIEIPKRDEARIKPSKTIQIS